jgi:signal recognition particle subunit SRP54
MERIPFNLDDFMAQMVQVKKLGPMGKVMAMIPGMSELTRQVQMNEREVEAEAVRMKAIYDSMTDDERQEPDLLDGMRRRRIAAGAGVSIREVGTLIRQFEMSRDMMRALSSSRRITSFKVVLGLVTDRRFDRDPSYVHSPPSTRPSVAILVAIVAIVVFAMVLATHQL